MPTGLSARAPQGFVPTEDQGYLIVAIQAPPGASLEYTRDIGRQISAITQYIPEVRGTFSVAGFSFGGSDPQRRPRFPAPPPYENAKAKSTPLWPSSTACAARSSGSLELSSFPSSPRCARSRSVRRISNSELHDQGNHTLQDLDKVTHDLTRAGGGRNDLARTFHHLHRERSAVVVSIDREKAKSLHIPLSQITDTLSVYMGSAYINDFDFNNRSYRVYVQADKQFRSHPQDIGQYYVRSDSGPWFRSRISSPSPRPLHPRSSATTTFSALAEIDGSAAPGFSSGQAIDAMQQLSRKSCLRATPTNGREFRSKSWLGIDHAHPFRPRNPGSLSHALGAV